MKEFDVTITETLKKTVTVEADSPGEAEQIVDYQWKNSEHILEADSFSGVSFKARSAKRNRDYER